MYVIFYFNIYTSYYFLSSISFGIRNFSYVFKNPFMFLIIKAKYKIVIYLHWTPL
jgi:hypothetical protein